MRFKSFKNFKSSKKAIELPVGFLVIIIISIIIFGFALYFLFKIRGEAEKIKVVLDKATEEEIKRLMAAELALVAIPFPTKEAKRGQWVTFGIGIRNIGHESTRFTVVNSFSHASLPDGSLLEECKDLKICKETINKTWIGKFAVRQTKELKPGEFIAYSIPFKVGHKINDTVSTKPAIYYFNICVFPGEETRTECDLEAFNPETSGLFYGEKIYQVSVIVS